MKKILSLFLAVLFVFSSFAFSASAMGGVMEDIAGDAIEDVFGEQEPDFYGIQYVNDTLSGATILYKPNIAFTFEGAGWVTVTNDTPIAIDHDFICWKDSKGNLYYEGDKVYVDGLIKLYAVWEEKQDEDSRTLRVIKAGISTLIRMVQKALGIFKIVDDFESSYYAETTTAVAA
ncbi:MAG: hypothetical protein IJ262_01130 [Clostridia bacterium]|nr:hypothetical protein [Clostridia bacterium]